MSQRFLKKQVASSLLGEARSVEILMLPGLPKKGDVSNWMDAGHSADELLQLVDAAEEFTSAGGSEHATKDSRSRSGSGTVSTEQLASEIVAHEYIAKDPAGRLFVYERGVYVPRGRARILERVKRLTGEWETKWSSYRAEEVVKYIAADAPELTLMPEPNVVNVENGLLWLSDNSIELRDHSPEHLSSIQLPLTYDPNAKCPAVERFITDVFPDSESHAVAWQLFGWLMVPDRTLQKAVLLLGDGRNGKSVFLSLLRQFLGRENTSSVSLHDLENNRFAISRLVGKLANICSDLPSQHLADTSVFKAVTGGDVLNAEFKHKGGFDFEPFARLVFSAKRSALGRCFSSVLPEVVGSTLQPSLRRGCCRHRAQRPAYRIAHKPHGVEWCAQPSHRRADATEGGGRVHGEHRPAVCVAGNERHHRPGRHMARRQNTRGPVGGDAENGDPQSLQRRRSIVGASTHDSSGVRASVQGAPPIHRRGTANGGREAGSVPCRDRACRWRLVACTRFHAIHGLPVLAAGKPE